ncbi:hypothetical protein HUJ04_000630 [Dendroctonus ponderosae]|nr:hypothetical protein HUJ04_000630 [Dendroctonus ponderosae]
MPKSGYNEILFCDSEFRKYVKAVMKANMSADFNSAFVSLSSATAVEYRKLSAHDGIIILRTSCTKQVVTEVRNMDQSEVIYE